MEDTQEFEAITLSNVWIKEHILDIIRKINEYEIIAETGGSDLFALNQMELVDILRIKIEGLGSMKAHLFILRDNSAQYINKDNLLLINLELMEIDNHETLLQNDPNQISHENNYYLSPHFDEKLEMLRRIKQILITACGDAELLMPKKDDDVKGKILEGDEDG